jgi:hypothetical protein
VTTVFMGVSWVTVQIVKT